MRDGSTMGCLKSVGSDLTRTRELPELQQNVSMQSGEEALVTDKDPNRTPTSLREVYSLNWTYSSQELLQRESFWSWTWVDCLTDSFFQPAAPVCSLESGVLGQRIRKSLNVAGEMQSTQDKRSRKTSMVNSIFSSSMKWAAYFKPIKICMFILYIIPTARILNCNILWKCRRWRSRSSNTSSAQSVLLSEVVQCKYISEFRSLCRWIVTADVDSCLMCHKVKSCVWLIWFRRRSSYHSFRCVNLW